MLHHHHAPIALARGGRENNMGDHGGGDIPPGTGCVARGVARGQPLTKVEHGRSRCRSPGQRAYQSRGRTVRSPPDTRAARWSDAGREAFHTPENLARHALGGRPIDRPSIAPQTSLSRRSPCLRGLPLPPGRASPTPVPPAPGRRRAVWIITRAYCTSDAQSLLCRARGIALTAGRLYR